MNPPANWYPDPTGRHGQRYWDGEQWTEHVFTDGVQSVDPLDAVVSESSTDGGADQQGDGTESSTDDGLPPLPKRQRAEQAPVADADGPLDAPVQAAEGLFDDARDEPPTSAPAGEPWTPEDGAATMGADVAPEVEPEDVVAAVDEMAEPADPDFSDAFVLAPETASRLVGRNEPEAPAEDEPADELAAADEPAAADVEPEALSIDEDEPEESPDADAAAAEPIEADQGSDDDAATDDDRGIIDAPPPTMPAPAVAPAGSLGISGDLVGGAFAEREEGGDVALQNARMLRCAASTGIVARQGTMVAYQGDVQFERQGAGGVGRALKRAATGEGLAMMRVTGSGDVFFADGGQHVFLLHLDGGPGLSVNGRNVLAFSASLQWDIERVKGASLLAGGLFNTTLTGTGWVALVADGEPVVLRTDEAPTYVDVNALVAWSGGLGTRIVNTVSAKSLVGLGSGEAFQMAFDGAGIVIVQPSEGPMGGPAAT